MTKSREKTENTLFEKWAKDKGYDLTKIGEDYESCDTNDAWFVWLARAELDYFD